MPLAVRDPELFGLTESTATLHFRVDDGAGPVDAPARVLLDGAVRAVSEGPAGTRTVRLEGLAPSTRYRLAIEVGGETAAPTPILPESFETHHAPPGGAGCVSKLSGRKGVGAAVSPPTSIASR